MKVEERGSHIPHLGVMWPLHCQIWQFGTLSLMKKLQEHPQEWIVYSMHGQNVKDKFVCWIDDHGHPCGSISVWEHPQKHIVYPLGGSNWKNIFVCWIDDCWLSCSLGMVQNQYYIHNHPPESCRNILRNILSVPWVDQIGTTHICMQDR